VPTRPETPVGCHDGDQTWMESHHLGVRVRSHAELRQGRVHRGGWLMETGGRMGGIHGHQKTEAAKLWEGGGRPARDHRAGETFCNREE